jgi:hypothetical protein
MARATGPWLNTQIDEDLDGIITDVITSTPLVLSRSALARYGIQLALTDLMNRDMVTDPELTQRIRDYLDSPSATIVAVRPVAIK